MYLAYNKFGEVQVTYSQEPSEETKDNFFGVIEFEGKPQKEGYIQDIKVDVETKEVIVEYIKIENKDEEVTKLQNQIDVLSKALEDTINLIMEG